MWLEGAFQLSKLVRDYAARLYRTECLIRQKNKPSIEQFVLWLENGIWALYSSDEIQIYGPTPQAASISTHGFGRQ